MSQTLYVINILSYTTSLSVLNYQTVIRLVPPKLGSVKPLRHFLPQLLLTVLLGAGLIQLTIMTSVTLYRHVEASQTAAIEEARIAALQNEINVLKERATQARTDTLYLERLARKQGFVKRGEQVLVPKVR